MCSDATAGRIEAERGRDAMEAKAAALVDALQRRATAEKDIAAAVKALGDVKNAAFIRSMHN
jgi:alpha-D-ribose 1-methylphosphonate 5-triphosphate synthase subunit PhnG